jgi:phosphatidate cytidylyltransferase
MWAVYNYEWGFFIIFFIAQFFCQLEFYKLVESSVAKPLTWVGLVLGSAIYTLTFLQLEYSDQFDSKYFAILFPLAGLIFLVELYRNRENPFANISYTILGVIYASMPFTLFVDMAYSTTGTYSFQIIIGTLLMLWASDSGAYFAGKTMGKTKLFERISPKKTWEGSAGGLVLSLLFAAGISHYWHDLVLWQWLCMSVIIVVIGGMGDLVESLLKRSMEVKDSSNAIPGHGGFLDRFDGLLLALPFLASFLILFC